MMATILIYVIYGKNPNTVLVDSQVSDRCPWATCLKSFKFYWMLFMRNALIHVYFFLPGIYGLG